MQEYYGLGDSYFLVFLCKALVISFFLQGLDLTFPDYCKSGLVRSFRKFRIFFGAIKWQNTVLLLDGDDSQDEQRLQLRNELLCSLVP